MEGGRSMLSLHAHLQAVLRTYPPECGLDLVSILRPRHDAQPTGMAIRGRGLSSPTEESTP